MCRITYWNPVRIFNSDDFPAPEGPIIAVNSPDLNSPDTPFIICLFSEMKKNLKLVTDFEDCKGFSWSDCLEENSGLEYISMFWGENSEKNFGPNSRDNVLAKT